MAKLCVCSDTPRPQNGINKHVFPTHFLKFNSCFELEGGRMLIGPASPDFDDATRTIFISITVIISLQV